MPRLVLPIAALTAALLSALAAPVTPTSAAAARVAATRAAAALPLPGKAQVAGGWQAPSARSLLLVNGDQVLSGQVPDARTAAVVPAPGGGLAASLTELQPVGKTLLIPLVALPYLGRGLDPSLFDLASLRRTERDGRLPVTIRYRGKRPAVPGITLTNTGAGRRGVVGSAWATADGYLTGSSAARFGAALARQLVADHGRASYGTDGLFAGGLSISLPGAKPASAHPPTADPAPGHPSPPMYTLTVTGSNLSGKPDTGDDVTVINVNDPTAFDQFRFFHHGTATFRVPAGTYWAVGQFVQFLDHGRAVLVSEDVLPQFIVAGNTAVHVTARAATSRLDFVAPRPAVPQFTMFEVYRFGLHGPCTANSCLAGPEYASYDFGAVTYSVNPVSHPPSDGILRAFVNAELASPRTMPGRPYVYALNLADPPGLIPTQHYAIHPADLATATEHYSQDTSSTGDWGGCAGTPFQLRQFLIICGDVPFRLPEVRTMYLSARPATYWQLGYYFNQNLDGGQQDSDRLPRPGQRFTENWNADPLHPSPNVSLPGADPRSSLPSAARTQNTLALDITPFSDNQRGHTGAGFSGGFGKLTGTYRLYDNGQKIAGGNAVHTAGGAPDLFVQGRLRPQPSRIRFVLNASWQAQFFRLSGASHDVWTWRTRRQPDATVPRQWYCVTSRRNPTRHCAVQPMMGLRYQVAGLSLTGTAAPGRQAIGITVSHLQLAASPPVTHTQVQVSFDNGKTWHTAAVRRLGPAQFHATFTAPASHDVSMRVVARDAAGNSIAETIRDGYQTGRSTRGWRAAFGGSAKQG